MLEGLAVLVAQLEGKLPESSDQWGQVTYGKLRSCERSWARGLVTYADSVTPPDRRGHRSCRRSPRTGSRGSTTFLSWVGTTSSGRWCNVGAQIRTHSLDSFQVLAFVA
jgi:hypothetical protein